VACQEILVAMVLMVKKELKEKVVMLLSKFFNFCRYIFNVIENYSK